MFKKLGIAATIGILGLGALASAPVFAQHGGYVRGGHGGGGHWHGSVGFYFGLPLYAPFYSPYYYPPAYYAYPPIVYAPPAAPPVYVESGEAQAPPQAAPEAPPQSAQSAPAQYWYYCADSNAYYPYVKDCPSPWQRVSPQPPSAGR